MYQSEIKKHITNLKTSKIYLNLTREEFDIYGEHGELRRYCNHSLEQLHNGINYLRAIEPEPQPEQEFTYTKYPLFGEGAVDFVSGMNPWDSHSINMPFTKNFTREQWSEGCELLSTHGVNFVRFFMATGTADYRDFIYPFKRIGNRQVDLFDYDHEDMVEYEWRLNELWKRGITTMLCLCSGIKGNRFLDSLWHGDRNRGYPEKQKDGSIKWMKLATDHNEFMIHKYSKLATRKVGVSLYKRWKTKPVVIEGINEPISFSAGENFNWNTYLFRGLKSNGCPGNKMSFGWFDSGKAHDLLGTFGCRTFPHGINDLSWFQEYHKPHKHLQKYYFTQFPNFGVDADGALSEHPGTGLVGWLWNKKFKRACPVHMVDGLLYTYDHSGGGWIIWSAGAWYNKNSSGRPNYNDWYHVAVEGLTKDECIKWNVKWDEFSHIPKGTTKRVPLGELPAIKLAMEAIFKEKN